VSRKTAPFNYCNNFVKPSSILIMMILAGVYLSKYYKHISHSL